MNWITSGNDLAFVQASGARSVRKVMQFCAELSHLTTSSDTISSNILQLLSLCALATACIAKSGMGFIMSLAFWTMAGLLSPSSRCVPGELASMSI